MTLRPITGTASYNPYQGRTIYEQGKFILPHLRPEMAVLDVGCGPGSMTIGIAELVAPGRVIGIDIDPRRIRQARELAAAKGVHNVAFIVADVYALPFSSGSFDAVFEHTVLQHLRTPLLGVQEVHRVLQPGGIFAARDHDYNGDLINGRSELLATGFKVYLRWNRHTGNRLRAGRRLGSLLRQGGFAQVDLSASFDSFGTPSLVRVWAEMMAKYFQDPELVSTSVHKGWTNEGTLKAISQAWLSWACRADAFYAQARCEAIARK